MGSQLRRASWHKSSHSPNSSTCVEVAMVGGQIAVRDSKRPRQRALVFGPDEWRAFVSGVCDGEFDI